MAEKTENKDDKDNGEYKPEFDIVEQPDEGQEKPDKSADKSAKTPSYEDDERLSASQRDEDDSDDDAGGVELDKGNETQAEIEAKRERRRRERKAQKARQNAARERDQREMNFLRTRNEQLEKRFGAMEERVTQNEMAQVESRLQQLKAAQAEAEEVLGRAIEANNGADVVKLNRTIRELEQGIGRLNAYKAGLTKEAEKAEEEDEGQEQRRGAEEGDGQGRKRPDPAVVKNLTVFAKRHPWFDPTVGDEDTRIVLALDEAVKADGFDPRTKDYWVELEERMSRRLPERMKAFKNNGGAKEERDEDDEDEPEQRNGSGKEQGKPKGGPRMSSGSQTRGSGKQFLLTAARKQAMIEAGVWDDPELRDKYIRSYAEWDKANPAQAGR